MIVCVTARTMKIAYPGMSSLFTLRSNRSSLDNEGIETGIPGWIGNGATALPTDVDRF